MLIELSAKIKSGDIMFYEELYLPATDGEIHDVLQKIRAFDNDNYFEIDVIDCPKLPELTQTGIEDVTLGELNIFAKRLNELSNEDILKLNGLFNYKKENELYDDEISIQELINIDTSLVKNLNCLLLLNDIAEAYQKMNTNDRIKYKSVLSGEKVENLMDAFLFSQILDKYEITDTPFEENHFFINYLQNSADIKIDMRWFRENSFAQQSKELVKNLGAKITEYGVVSAYGEPLYKFVPRYAEKEVRRTMPEKFEFVEVAGQKVLFSNGRIANQEIPKGLHKYELRDDGSGEILSLEHSVLVNCAGTVITQNPVCFGNSDFVSLEGDSAMGFLGEEMTAEEFAAEDFSQDKDETIEMKM